MPINEAVAIVVGLGLSDDVIGLDDISKEFFPFEAMGLEMVFHPDDRRMMPLLLTSQTKNLSLVLALVP